jgi:chemotaxis response regulator CheB
MGFPRSQAGAPVAGEESSVDMTGVVSNGPDRPIRLLVVDDDPRMRQAIAPTIALEPDLVIVAEAADAMTALAFAEGTAPSVALVDVLLPDELAGLALARSLARRPGCAVVAMSVRGPRPSTNSAGSPTARRTRLRRRSESGHDLNVAGPAARCPYRTEPATRMRRTTAAYPRAPGSRQSPIAGLAWKGAGLLARSKVPTATSRFRSPDQRERAQFKALRRRVNLKQGSDSQG